MRLRSVAWLLWAAACLPVGLQAAPAVMEQPATLSAKAARAAMLAVTSAGPRLVAVGEAGIVQLSDDAGKTWRQAPVPTSVALTAVRFVDARQGWAVGHFGTVLHTADGGETWTRQLDGVRAATLVLEAARASGEAQAITAAELLVSDGPDKPLLDLVFSDTQQGLVVGAYNLLFRTDDGGKTWQVGKTANPKGLHLYGLARSGAAWIVAGEQGLLMRSNDHGASFSALPSPYKGSFFGIVAAPGGELVAYGLRGNAFWSGDQGSSWQKLELGTPVSLSGGVALADGRLALVSQAGEVFLSSDKGRSFQRQTQGMALPLAGIAQASDGALVGASLRGVLRLAP